jgi:hypothetical protein
MFPLIYNGVWASGGPDVFNEVLKRLCLTQNSPYMSPKTHNAESCHGMSIVPSRYFYPISWFDGPILSTPALPSRWEEMFKDSYAVHFYASSNPINKKVLKAKYYGKEVPAYLTLGTQNCPISFDSQRLF